MTLSVKAVSVTKPVSYNLKDSDPLIRQRIVLIQIENTGSAPAHGCEAYLTALDDVPLTDALPLKWAAIEGVTRTILQGSSVQLDVVGIADAGFLLHDQSDIRPLKPVFSDDAPHKFTGLVVCAGTGQQLPFTVVVTNPSVSATLA